METTVLKHYEQAGSVWKNAITFAAKQCKEGKNLLELAQEVEARVHEAGAKEAFPINLSINEEAAHFTPKWNDTYTLKESDLLKIDIGVHVEGYICDGAVTINLDNTYSKQIEANELALNNALSVAEFGKPVEKIGAMIEKTLKEKNFNPVYNLGGHGLGKFTVHAPPQVPNHAGGSQVLLEEGALAIEPFASTGKGHVSEVQNVEIFSVEKTMGVRAPSARKLLTLMQPFGLLPFAERWLRKEATKAGMESFQITLGLKELMKSGCIHSYPGLKESKTSMVTQVEKSVLILEEKTIILGE